MTSETVDKVARAILYEGYLLYPYRQSALKNQQRWNFGVLYPPAWTAKQTGSDRSYFQMENVLTCTERARITLSVRFLQLAPRRTGERIWQEAIEHKIDVDSLSPAGLVTAGRLKKFSMADSIEGQLELAATQLDEHLFRLTVRVRNTHTCQSGNRDEALLHSLASAHVVLEIEDGACVSQIDPPQELRDAVAACQNLGVWPVLIGETGTRNIVLGSPIILYDYPQVAPESQGDLFDATEIDEILTLRILTLTDQEKDEVRRSDERGRRILERLESSPPEHLLALHGTMRGMSQAQNDPWSAWDTLEGARIDRALVSGVEVKKGDRVRLRPRKRADIFDTLLEGKIAIVEALEEDFECNIHFAVVLEDDPGRDFGEMRQAGHRFFFSPEEVEPIESVSSESIS